MLRIQEKEPMRITAAWRDAENPTKAAPADRKQPMLARKVLNHVFPALPGTKTPWKVVAPLIVPARGSSVELCAVRVELRLSVWS